VSSAEAVVKWLEVHPYLHAAQHTSSASPGLVLQQQVINAEQELGRLRPFIDSVTTEK